MKPLSRVRVIAVLFTLLFSGCSLLGSCDLFGLGGDDLLVMTYNLHNLFDDVYDGSEYSEFIPDDGGWGSDAYHARLRDFGRVIRGTRGSYGQGPDIIILTEVENQRVVEDLRDRALGQRRYPVALATAVPGSAIQIGLLSRLPVEDVRLHAVYPHDDRTVRPILEAAVQPPGSDSLLHIFAGHWPSKIGGEHETEPYRLQSAAVVMRRVRQLRKQDEHAMVLIAGDLNQTLPDNLDRCRVWQAQEREAEQSGTPLALRSLMSACLYGSDQLPAVPGKKPLFVTGNVHIAADDPYIFFSPWSMTDFPGSYVFRDEWEDIDHFLLGNGLTGEQYWPVEYWVESHDWMLTPSGYPRGYRPSQRSGLSDHLPIVLRLRPVQ